MVFISDSNTSMNAFLRFLLITTVFYLVSCQKKKDLAEPSISTIDYFPLKLGAYFIYDVSKTDYNLAGKKDTSFQLKVVLKETWVDLESRTSYKVFRYKKPNGGLEFAFDSIWHAVKDEQIRAIVTENNVPFVKLSLPLLKDKTWNGNLFNTYPEQIYKVSNIGNSFGVYSNTATILQNNVSNLLQKNYSSEIYAENIGLVYKELQDIKLEFGTGRITEGIVYRQRLVSYGVE
jgi:hypothetical protein